MELEMDIRDKQLIATSLNAATGQDKTVDSIKLLSGKGDVVIMCPLGCKILNYFLYNNHFVALQK